MKRIIGLLAAALLLTAVPAALAEGVTLEGTVQAGRTVSIAAPYAGIVGDFTVKAGDEVICFGKCGKDSITPDDWAALKGTHAYDIICSLGTRVQRVVKG